MADGTGAAAGPAAAAPAVPALSSSARLRNKQASDYMHQLKLHFSLAARNLSPEQRLQRHEQVVRAAFAGCPGAPDPALWAVRVRGQQALGAQASYSYRHTGGFAQGRKFNNLVTVARELANAHAAELARAPGPEDDSQLPTSPVAAVSEADASSGTRVLARVHQTVSEDGVLAHYAAKLVTLDQGGDAGAGGPTDADEAEEAQPAAPLMAAIERTRIAVSEEVCSAVLIGGSGAGKSSMLNVLLLLSECDESTYASDDHNRGAPKFEYKGAPYQYEALGVIRQLLLDDGVTADELQSALDARVVMKSPSHTDDAAHAKKRKEAQENIYDPVSRFAFDGLSAFMKYVHPVGSRTDVTTRVTTADRYGTRYHACAEMVTETELRCRLHAFLLRERALRAVGTTIQTYRAAVEALDAEERERRRFDFMTWNACVDASLALSDKGHSEKSLTKYERQLGDLPPLFTSPDLTLAPEDILLHPEIQPRLGKFELYAGRGKRLHMDRDFVAERLHMLTGENTRQAYVLKKMWAFGPWALLQGGKELLDVPGTADLTPLHREHVKDACRTADHIILVADRNISLPPDTLACMSEFGVLSRFLNPNERLQLSIVHNHERSCMGLANFRARDPDVKTESQQLSMDALLNALSKETEMDLDVLQRLIDSRVRVFSVYTLLYAGLKLFPERAAQLDDLQQVLEETQGAQLLGLLEGLNLERVADLMEELHTGPLAAAQAAVQARLARTQVQLPETGRLRAAAAALLKPRQNGQHYRAKKSMHLTLSQQFDPNSEDAPRGALKAELDAAFEAFSESLDAYFAGDARSATQAHWERVRPRFLKPENAAKAHDAHAALAQGTPPPSRMDLEDLIWNNVSLPVAPFDALVAGLDDGLTLCEEACCNLLNEQLVAIAGSEEPQVALARRLIESEFSEQEGRQILREKLARVRAKLSRYRVVVLLNKAKREALKVEVGDKPPVVTTEDVAGVATLVNQRLGTVLSRVLARFKASVRAMLDNLSDEAQTALKPVQERQHKAKTVPAMEEYIDAALAYVVAALDPETHDERLRALRAAHRRGVDVASRVGTVVSTMRAVLRNPESLGAAAERYLDTLTLLRLAHADDADTRALARPEQLNQRNNGPLPRPAWQLRKLNLGATGPDLFAEALASTGDARHLDVVETALAALAPVPLAVHRLPNAPAGESLWYALAHQLFSLTTERNPTQLKNIVLKQMTLYYSSPKRREDFQRQHGVRVNTYLDELRSGARPGGLLELYFAAFVYTGVQVCVWVSAAEPPASTPLLIYHSRGAPADRCYNLVLEEGGSGFCSVSKLRRAGASVSFSGLPETVHEYELLPGERRGRDPVPAHHHRPREDDEGDSGGPARQRARR